MNTKLTFPGLKELMPPVRPGAGPAAPMSVIGAARALFRLPDAGVTGRRRSVVDFLAQVSVFEDLARRDLARLAHIVHERDYGDGEYICEEGRPGAALYIVRRGVVEVVRRGAGTREVPIALLEPPASFEESAAIGTGVIRWFSVRARGQVSLLALGRSDVDGLIANFPVLANKVLIRLAGIMAMRLEILTEARTLGDSEDESEAPS
jgi:CRP-like cAMP-binding protein